MLRHAGASIMSSEASATRSMKSGVRMANARESESLSDHDEAISPRSTTNTGIEIHTTGNISPLEEPHGDNKEDDRSGPRLYNLSFSNRNAVAWEQGDMSSQLTSTEDVHRWGTRKTSSHNYHWEPDVMYAKDSSRIDLELLERERCKEMNWLRGFEGA